MNRRPAAALLSLALAVGLVLTGCASESPPAASPSSAPEVTPTPTPAPAPPLIGSGERPPALFGGDCRMAVSADVLAAATGAAGVELSRRDVLWTRSVDSLGGLSCEWQAEDIGGRVDIVLQHALDGARLPAEQHAAYFGECGWSCAWIWESEDLWISGYDSQLVEVGREEADRRGGLIGADIASRLSDAGESWRLDRSDWWPQTTCEGVAAAVGSRLGAEVTAEPLGYHDPPSPAVVISDIASRWVRCEVASSGDAFAVVAFTSGVGWDVPWAGMGEPVELGVAGIEAYAAGGGAYLSGPTFEMTDGVNSAWVEVAPASPWPAEEVAALVADIAADGLR